MLSIYLWICTAVCFALTARAFDDLVALASPPAATWDGFARTAIREHRATRRELAVAVAVVFALTTATICTAVAAGRA